MRTAHDILGLPIFDSETGKRLGKVRDLLVDEAWRARGVVLDYKSWFSPGRYAEWKEISAFGEDALTLRSRHSVLPLKRKEHPDWSMLCTGKRKIQGTALLTGEGVHLGQIEDVYFSQKMEDSIIGFELSEGFLTDLREGRKRLPIPEGAERGEDVILVPVYRLEEAGTTSKKE